MHKSLSVRSNLVLPIFFLGTFVLRLLWRTPTPWVPVFLMAIAGVLCGIAVGRHILRSKDLLSDAESEHDANTVLFKSRSKFVTPIVLLVGAAIVARIYREDHAFQLVTTSIFGFVAAYFLTKLAAIYVLNKTEGDQGVRPAA